MQNTGTIYSSTERTPVVLPEMAELLPPLSGEQLDARFLASIEAEVFYLAGSNLIFPGSKLTVYPLSIALNRITDARPSPTMIQTAVVGLVGCFKSFSIEVVKVDAVAVVISFILFPPFVF